MNNVNRREFLGLALASLLLHNGRRESLRSVKSLQQWARYRREILRNMEEVMGPLPRRPHVTLDIRKLEESDLGAVTRTKLTYRSEKGDHVPAYLLIPKSASGRVAAVLCLHQTTPFGAAEPAGIRGNPNLHYALELAKRGYVTLAPDYPGCGRYDFGGYKFDPYTHGYASDTMLGIYNNMRAIDLLESLPEVARDRIGCIGHSLGGHNTLFLGVFDQRVRALVSSCGFTSFAKYAASKYAEENGGQLAPWSQKVYMPRIATMFGNDPARMPFDFSDVLAALAPRPLFVNAPLHDFIFDVSGVRDCLNSARHIYSLFHAQNNLVAVFPDASHSFPPAAREQAYEFLDRWLKQ
ncbi:MAG: alpha/beta hydrolase family protein [Acidobacteria bacterium]|nr:alpha/beta hydrolase family protein [Acidobacteriota bacterium]